MREVERKSYEEPSTKRGLYEILDNDDLSEEKMQSWTKNKEPYEDKSPLEIHIIMLPPFIKEFTYEHLIWLIPRPHSFGLYFEASQAHHLKRSFLAQTLLTLPNIAKHEGIYNRDP